MCGRKQFMRSVNKYIRHVDWRDLAMLKLCLCAIGIFIGAVVPNRVKKPILFTASAVFVATYIPLMGKFFNILTKKGLLRR